MCPNPDDMVVGDHSAAVRDLGSGFSLNEYGHQRKIHSFKTSLYLSIDSPKTAAGSKFIRNRITAWLSHVKSSKALKGQAISITPLNRKRLDVASLRTDGKECEDLVGWKIKLNDSSYKNVFLCVVITTYTKFLSLKHSMIEFLKESQIQMARNHSLGDKAIEMAAIGNLSPALPDLLFLLQLEDGLNRAVMKQAKAKADAAEIKKKYKINVNGPGEHLSCQICICTPSMLHTQEHSPTDRSECPTVIRCKNGI
eukprot:scaffold1634_cov95-Cylindrotheca_fusiformis.AAC.3